MPLRIGITAVLVALLAAGGFFLYRASTPSLPPPPPETEDVARPWIEVKAPRVVEHRGAEGEVLRELATGDELSSGATVESFEGGRANIYFPDGSVARLDQNSKLIVQEGMFDEKTSTLRVRLNLLFGRVWSKVISLSTPDSVWEVKTSNAVVTVRGTAFGVEYEKGKSRVVGGEKKVVVIPIDPVTAKPLPVAELVVEEKRFVVIDASAVKRLSGVPGLAAEMLAPVAAPRDVFEEEWIKRSLDEDRRTNERIQELRGTHPKEEELRLEFRKEVIHGFIDDIRERRKIEAPMLPESEKGVLPEIKGEPPRLLELKPAEPPLTPSVVPSPSSGTRPTPKALSIEVRGGLLGIKEGNTREVRATLLLSDGTKRDVTSEAVWQVVGPIGSMSAGNIFVPKLALSVSELGEGTGAIVATWKDPRSGEALVGKTPLFRVEAHVEFVIPEG